MSDTKLPIKGSMPLSDLDTEADEKVMGTSSSQNFQSGEKNNTESKLGAICQALEGFLVSYQKNGGIVLAITVSRGSVLPEQEHVIILPAIKNEDGSYSLLKQK